MISWRGLVYLLAIGLSLLILTYTGMDIFLHLVLLMAVLPPLAAVQLLLIMRRLSYSQELEQETITRGQKAFLVVNLHQKGLLASGMFDLTIRRPAVDKGKSFRSQKIVVLRKETRRMRLPLPAPHRGIYSVGITRFWVRDIFGLFWLPLRSRKKLQRELLTLTVMPREIELQQQERLASMLDNLQLQKSRRVGEDLDDIANLRGQIPGDSLKRVHWKLTARLNETMIKEYERPQQQEILVLWNLEKIPLPETSEVDFLDRFTDIAASAVRDILTAGSSVCCVSYQEQGRRQLDIGGPESLDLAKIELAGLEWTSDIPAESIIVEEAAPEKQISMLFLFTTQLSRKMLDSLRRLSLQGTEVMLIFIPVSRPDTLLQRRLDQMEAEGIHTWIHALPDTSDSTGQVKRSKQSFRKDEKTDTRKN